MFVYTAPSPLGPWRFQSDINLRGNVSAGFGKLEVSAFSSNIKDLGASPSGTKTPRRFVCLVLDLQNEYEAYLQHTVSGARHSTPPVHTVPLSRLPRRLAAFAQMPRRRAHLHRT